MPSLSSALAELWSPRLDEFDDLPIPPESTFRRLSPFTAVPAINTTPSMFPARCTLTETDKQSAKSGEPEHVLHFPVTTGALTPAYVRIVVYDGTVKPPKIELVSRFRRAVGRFYKLDSGAWQFSPYADDNVSPLLGAFERLRIREILRLQPSETAIPSINWGSPEAPVIKMSAKDATPNYD